MPFAAYLCSDIARAPARGRRIDRGRKMRLYADHRVPYYWVVDGEARVIEAFGLAGGAYAPVARLEGSAASALPPFADLRLDPTLVWA